MENLDYRSNGHSLDDGPRESPLHEYLAIILRGKWIIILSVLLVAAVSAYKTFRTKPVYEASSLVLIEMKGGTGTLPFFDPTGSATFSKLTNEIEILKSRSMAEAVADALLKKIFLDDRKTIIPVLQVMIDDEPQEELTTRKQVTDRLLGSVSFSPIRDSDLIRIIARSTNKQEAALLANTYTEVYAERNLATSRVRSRAVREFLQSQLDAKRAALDTAEDALQGYMRSSGTISLDGEANKVVQQLSQLEASRDAIEVDITSRSRTLTSMKEELSKQEPNVAKAIEEANDTYVKLLQEQLARLSVQRDVVIAQNPTLMGQTIYSEKLKEIDAQIASMRKTLQNRTITFVGSVLPGGGSADFLAQLKQKIIEQRIELEGLEARKRALNLVIADYERQFNQIPQKSIELAKLQRARLSNEKLYLLVEEKFNEASITEKSEFGYVDIVDPAIVPGSPVSPDVRRNIMLGALLGLGLGIGVVLLRAYLDVRVRTIEDLKRYGFVPLSAISRLDGEVKKIRVEQHTDENGKSFDARLVTYFNPLSAVAESYRRLRTSVQYAQLDKPLKTIVVTSANPGEGKSTTVTNLAVAFAKTEMKVLLIDSDMRRPTVHSFFGLNETPGLTELLFGRHSFDQCVRKDVLENLDILTCGTVPPNPTEILGSKRMLEVLNHVGEKYDIVLFDSPPLLAVTDAAVLSTGVDAAILVASAGTTRVAAIERAAEFLSGIGGKVLGVVLNNFDMRKAYGGYYGSHKYSYYGYGEAYNYSHESNGGSKKRGERKA